MPKFIYLTPSFLFFNNCYLIFLTAYWTGTLFNAIIANNGQSSAKKVSFLLPFHMVTCIQF
jgi:hypothetical protein